MENQKTYVTQLELERSQNKMRTDLKKEISTVDDKVDDLKSLVLPLVETSKQTAKNTRKIADAMQQFTEEQRRTNGKFYDKFSENDVEFAGIKGKFEVIGTQLAATTESKANNTKVIVAVIGTTGTIIVAIFAAAPYIFG